MAPPPVLPARRAPPAPARQARRCHRTLQIRLVQAAARRRPIARPNIPDASVPRSAGGQRRSAAAASADRRRVSIFSVLSSCPGDVQTAGHRASDPAAPYALQRAVFRRIPRVGHPAALGVERHAGVVALGRRHHPKAPVFGDHRHPVAGQIDRRRRLARRRRTAAPRRRAARPVLAPRDERDDRQRSANTR